MARPMMLDDQIRHNKRKTVLLFFWVFVILTGLIFAGCFAFGLPLPIVSAIALGGTLVYMLIASSAGPKTILSEARARAPNLNVREEKLLVYAVEEMAIAAQIPVPKVYVQDDEDINAFATGKDPQHGIVCVTTGALHALNKEELQGVIAHELSHIKNYDIRVTTYAIILIGIIAMFSEILLRSMIFGGGRRDKQGGHPILIIVGIVLVILAPILSRLVYFAISRQREYLADASGAYLTRNPEGLASALEKIGSRQPNPNKGDRTVASLYFDNPFRKAHAHSVFATHPPIKDRVARLRGRQG